MTYEPYTIYGANRTARWIVTCDHAANTIPATVNNGSLGISESDMNRHIAYDVGAKGVAVELGKLLNAPVICSNFSRLVIDPNRGEDDPTLLMKLYDGTIIEGNRFADETEKQRRLDLCHRPYHRAVAELAAQRDDAILVSLHSFTPQLKGRAPRPWHIGILSAQDRRFNDALLARLNDDDDLCVGDNEPYNGDLPGDSIDQHALQHGRLNTLIEIRNDLIETELNQITWARRLAPILSATLNDMDP